MCRDRSIVALGSGQIKRQQGVALIVALSIVALASSFAAVLIQKNHVLIKQAQQAVNVRQAQDQIQQAQVEAKAQLRGQLALPLEARNWHQSTEVDDASTPEHYQLLPADGRMNINNLFAANGEVDSEYYQLLAGLFEQQGVGEEKLEAIVDWMRPTQDAAAIGDGFYQRRTPSYLAARQPMRTLTELRMIAGITEETYARLVPVVTTLPPGSRINLNAAPQAVLDAVGAQRPLADDAMEDGAEPPPVYTQVADFFTAPPEQPEYFAVESQFYLAVLQSEQAAHTAVQLVLLFTDQEQISVITRTDQPCQPNQLCI